MVVVTREQERTMTGRYDRPGAKFGQYLRDCREAGGKSQREVAVALDIRENTFAQWERGNFTYLPEPTQFHSMIRAVGGTPDDALRQVGYLSSSEVEEEADVVQLFARIQVEVMHSGLSPYLKSVVTTALQHARELQEAAEEDGMVEDGEQ